MDPWIHGPAAGAAARAATGAAAGAAATAATVCTLSCRYRRVQSAPCIITSECGGVDRTAYFIPVCVGLNLGKVCWFPPLPLLLPGGLGSLQQKNIVTRSFRGGPGGPSGLAWLGLAWLGLAWLGLAWLGLACLGLACLGLL